MPHALTQAEIDATFPLIRAKRPGTFEIGFALAGTVSAGAYTAGVLDYLMEALDAWEAAKRRGDPDAPTHKVTISTLVGASGGALNGAIFLRAAGWDFPHGAVEGNPFYDAWAGPYCVTIGRLLTGTSAQPGVTSIVDTAAIERVIQALIAFEGRPLPQSPDGATPPQRGYLADPLRLVVTMSNLIGTPYRVGFAAGPDIGFDFWRHDDTARFALHVGGGDVAGEETPRIGEIALASVSGTNWDRLKAAALATCAFPLVFNSRDVARSAPEIAARVALVSQPDGADPRLPMTPRWDLLDPWLTRNPSAPMVDGGLTNNEPIGLAHQELAGIAGINDRRAEKATRALILIDPFVASNKMPERPTSLPGLAGLVVAIFLNQSRYRAEDILSAVNSKVFSRFLIAPGPEGAGGESSLASGGLHAFAGFLDTALLKHDFLLGRYNAFQFLTLNFRFDPDNPLLSKEWTADQIATHTSGIYVSDTADPAEAGFVPMIPLMAALRDERNRPKKPARAAPLQLSDARRKELGGQIEARLDHLFKSLKPSGGLMSSAWSALFGPIWFLVRKPLSKKILGLILDRPSA